jgi:hypothetical protein
VADYSVVCYDDMTTMLDELPLESNATAVAINYSLPSCLIRFPYLHTCILFTSPRCLCITHNARHFNVQVSSVTSRMTLGANGLCYITDDSWRKCLLLDHGYNAVAKTLGPAAMLCPVFCTGSWQKMTKMSKRVKYCGSTHTLRPPPDEGGDVC